MRLSRLGLVLVLLGVAKSAAAQVPLAEAPAQEPAPGGVAEPSPAAPEPSAAEPAAEGEPPAPESAPTPVPEAAPAPEKSPESPSVPAERGTPVAPPPIASGPLHPPPKAGTTAPSATPWIRAHSPLTLDGRLGLLWRPESSSGFDKESHVGAELGLSLYWELKRELSAGLELEHAGLGRGSAMSGLDSVSIDYTVTSAMLGVRAYPKRTELFDVFVSLQLGLGIQGVSAAGTASNGPLASATAYKCGGSAAPGFQIGGGVGARFMISPRWGLTGRLNGTGRHMTSDVVDACARGLGTATTVSASLGLGYDFDLDP